MQRIGVLNGNNITYDHDLAGLVRWLTDWGVIQGGEISGNKVQPVQAVIACQRSNGQKLMLYFESDEQVAMPSSGTFKVYIEVNQAKIDDGSENTENGTGIASIKTWPSVPSQNSLLLASVADWVITDERNLIPKIQQVAQRTDSLEKKMETQEQKVEKLEEAGTPSYLGITGIVGEKYTMEDTLFLQKTPSFVDSTIAINVGDTNANKEQHIQRISSGESSNQLKLKMDKFWAPTTSVVVEVRKGIKVDVSNKEAYRYGGEVVASTTIAYTEFTTEWKEFTLTLNNKFWATKGELLDIVVYQQWGIVNWTNYYQIACDATQYSEAFSAVAVNGSSRVRSRLMPYCVSEGFLEKFLVKKSDEIIEMEWDISLINEGKKSYYLGRNQKKILHTFTGYKKLHISWWAASFWSEYWFAVKVNGVNRYNWGSNLDNEIVCDPTDVVTIVAENYSGYDKNLEYSYLKIKNKKPSLKKNNTELLPRKLVAIGESVATTLLGLHTDNNWKPYEKKQAKNLDLTINQYGIDSQRVAPSDWFLIVRFFEWLNSWITIGQDYFYVNNAILKITIPVFVRKWIVPIQSDSGQAHIKLLYFIPL